MEITKEQVLDIYNMSQSEAIRRYLEFNFRDAFKVKLEVGMVIKRIKSDTEWIVKVCDNYRLYGINTNGNYFDSIKDKETIELILNNEKNKESTTAEWHAALIAEAKKRGYKNGNYECLSNFASNVVNTDQYYFDDGWLCQGDALIDCNMIFNNGIWAEIIKTFSKEEAEKLLGGKII